jgi:hypothetical protein
LRSSISVNIPEKVLAKLSTSGVTRDTELASLQEVFKRVRGETSGAAYAELSGSITKAAKDVVVSVRGDAKVIEKAVSIVEKGLEELVSICD